MTLLRVALLLLVAGVAACGGSSGGDPQPPELPDPVEEITEADLVGADVPALPLTAAASASGARSASASGDHAMDIVVENDETHAIGHLTPTETGFVTSGIAEGFDRRIIAYAMYELPEGAGNRIRSIEFSANPGSDARLFYAVGNFSLGRWEPGRRIAGAGPGGGPHVINLSPGQQYTRADGMGYLLLLLGHSGAEDLNGYSIEFSDVLISSFDVEGMRNEYIEQENLSIDWGDGQVDSFFAYNPNLRFRQQYGGFSAQQQYLLLPQPLMLDGAVHYGFEQALGGDFDADGDVDGADFLAITGDWNGDGADTIGFYDPQELNAARHPYRLSGRADIPAANGVPVTVAPLAQVADGGNTTLGIIAILIGFQGRPAEGIKVDLLSGDDVLRSSVSDARGRIALPDVGGLDPGVYSLSLNFEEIKLFDAELLEHENMMYLKVGDVVGE
jgi:hypothetical protein